MMTDATTTIDKILINGYFNQYPSEAAKLLNTLNEPDLRGYLATMPIEDAVNIFSLLHPDISSGLIEAMDKSFFQQIFNRLDPGLSARLLSRLDKKTADQKLKHLSQAISNEIREFMTYPIESAGYIMDPKVNVFYPDQKVKEALKAIRKIKRSRIVGIHIIEENGKLIGVISLQELAVASPNDRLGDIIQSTPISVDAFAPKEEIVQLLEDRKLVNLPVVNIDGILLGTIRYDALVEAAKLEVSEDVQAMFGAGKEERALSKVSFAVRKRLPWLEINLATAFLAASVVGLFEETIARITVLAVFLPVVAGQSGNTGSQSLAVTMRGLALREFRPKQWFRIARKETMVGFINGCAVALTTSLIVYLWESSLPLAAIIGSSMIISMVVAGFSGAVIPIILKVLGQDPAQSSSIILTTVTDIVGFFSFLGLATLLIKTIGIA
jgi:magnesium transporter